MRAADIIPSMYHRRLVLLAGAAAVGTLLLTLGLARLTIVEADRLRADAEARLVSTHWLPTVRGRILDRRGRVLALDRPSFDLSMGYPAISGTWAPKQAEAFARSRHRDRWPELSDEARAGLVARYTPAFADHLEGAWGLLANAAGLEEGEADRRRSAVIGRVRAMGEAVRAARIDRAITEEVRRGRRITPELRAAITAREQRQKLAEETGPHVIAACVDDRVGFALLRLVGRDEAIEFPAEGGLPAASWRVPVIPLLAVNDASARDRPFDEVTVAIDRSTLPGPVRGEGPESIVVRGAMAHLLGRVAPGVQREDLDRRAALLAADSAFAARVAGPDGSDRGSYATADRVGRLGVEGGFEHRLRGLRGIRVERLDSGDESETAAVPGDDVRLTIDVMLQARVLAAMSPEVGLAVVRSWQNAEENALMPEGSPIHGAAVVIEVATGEILAMVSTPTPADEGAAPGPDDAIDQPWVNRAIDKPYPPGSIAKAMVLAEAVSAGAYRPGDTIACTGHLLPGRPDILRCWIYRDRYGLTTHSARLGHDPEAVGALMVSCNIFFYTLGRRLGPSGIAEAYRKFGVGDRPALGLAGPEPYPGTIGAGAALSMTDAIMMGIGQGPVAWTPLHAADAYATLARGGVRVPPRLVVGTSADSADPADLGLDPRGVGLALAGLRAAVNERDGTGHHLSLPDGQEVQFELPGIDVLGKTGTAQASPVVADPDGDGPEPGRVVRAGDHSWYVVLAGPAGQPPAYSIAVLMEHAGSGGRVSGPIVKQVLLALAAEGYLPAGTGPDGGAGPRASREPWGAEAGRAP